MKCTRHQINALRALADWNDGGFVPLARLRSRRLALPGPVLSRLATMGLVEQEREVIDGQGPGYRLTRQGRDVLAREANMQTRRRVSDP